MNIVFVEGLWLWLLLLVPLFWFLPHRAPNRIHAAIRSAMVILLILALARPALLTDQEDSYQVVLLDRSESVGADVTGSVAEWIETLPDSSRVRVVTLDGRRQANPESDSLEAVSLPGSSVGQALSVGARLIPEGAVGALTLVGDGMSTDRLWGDAVRQLVEREIPVHTVAISNPGNDLYPSAIRSPHSLRVGQSTKLIVDVIGSTERAVVTVSAGEKLLARSAPFSCTGRAEVELEFEPAQSGSLEVVANVEVTTGVDITPENNLFRSTLAVQEPIRALYLGERLTNSREKLGELLGPGVDLSEPSRAELEILGRNPEELSVYDLVMIDDRPSESIPPALQESIVEAVKEDGVGLFYAGGKGAYGTGGYFDTPIASILPVEMIQKEEKRDPSTTLVVIIDTSGSMTGERVQLAKECARLAIRRLLPHDKVGIVEFYGTKQWAAPIQSAANGIEIQRAINRLDAGGGTVILPAIEEAFYAMQNVQTRYKHVIVLTDGGVESGDFEGLMRRMSAKGINVSTVLVGSDAHSEFLVNIANWGKGHFYSASNRFNIPEILLKQPSTSKIPPYRPGVHLVSMGGPSGWWGEIARPEEPKLSGYVETRLRPGAQIAVETETERHPVLASWRFGLGRVSAFTTEPVGEGTEPWREWDDYGAWLLRVLTRTAREHPQPFAYTIQRSRTEARLIAQALTDQPYRPRAERLDGEANGDPVEFSQRSPDVFTAKLQVDPETTIHLRAGADDWTGSMAHLVSPAWHAVAPERNVDPAGGVDFALLASATGGKNVALENLSGLEPTPGGMGTAKDLYRLWPWCLIFGLLLYFGDILYRRWPGSTGFRMKKVSLILVFMGSVFLATAESKAELSANLEEQLQLALKEDPFEVDDEGLYNASLVEEESLAPLLGRLEEIMDGDDKAFEPVWLSASLQWRYGKLDEALELFRKAEAIKAQPLAMFRVAQLLDAKGDAGGAAEQYLKTLEAEPDEKLAGRIQLRLALLKSTGVEVEKIEEDLSAYAATQDRDFQNRAGVVLALTGKPKEALALYKPDAEGNQTFKQLIRIAEWSMAAKDLLRAQEAAWGALRSARLKRDRRYALTVLAESYRSEKKLDELIKRFAATPDLSEEARMAWIGLLREQGDAEEALVLFQEARGDSEFEDGFSDEMRRELLEICREAGRDDLLVENFREMIVKEPRNLEWRSGLCRFYLERGEREKGLAVWTDYQEQAQRGDWLAASGAAMELGLDQLARSFAEQLILSGKGKEPVAALQFLFDLNKARGREDDMKAVLIRMDELAAPNASERAQIAESWEQLGRQDKAIEVLENLREARGREDFSSDLETRLAWLYSETGAEEKAFEAWKNSWLRIESPGRRRYVEDRLMATASRLGKLADIAIELEEKLADGTANKRDSGLLVRLYTKIGDPVSASEIIHEFMTQSGGDEIKMLEEQARVYVMCNDYYHYDKTLRNLIELDPEGTPEYLTQLAMSALERGRNDEARSILTEMRGLDENAASAEFEAGVLKIAGMHQEAAAAYWRGIGQNPDRIDAYLLLGRALQTLGESEQAVGIFQYLVENADKDDLFTIAVDGLLNMNNPQQGSRLEPETLLWARRAILERLADKDDKVYLFQLASDVSEDLRDQPMMIRALAETLPVAGERRTSQLRELMELARVQTRNEEATMRFGRRLIGLGEIIPPQVYLDLGSLFLDNGDIRNAVKTFEYADGGLDYGGYQRQVASTFEKRGYARSALRSYEKLLITQPNDVEVLVKIGELKERLGRDEEAALVYRRALKVLLDGQPLFNLKEQTTQTGMQTYYRSRNADRFDKYYPRVLTGILAVTDPEGKAHLELIVESLASIRSDLDRAKQEREADPEMKALTFSQVPRVSRRSRLVRRLCFVFGELEKGYQLEELLLNAFPEDETLLPALCRTWNAWGYAQPARALFEAFPDHPGNSEAAKVFDTRGAVGARQVFQLIRDGNATGSIKRSVDLSEVMGDRWSSEELNSALATARFFNDSAAIERLAIHVISTSPDNQKVYQGIRILTRVFPYLDDETQARLISYLEGVIQDQGEKGTANVSYYYFANLRRVVGDDLKLPAGAVRPKVFELLAKGGRYSRYIGSLFSFLDREDYQDLLRETYRKAKSSDRLLIVFSLIMGYPGEIDPGLEVLFSELIEESLEETGDDPLAIFQNARKTTLVKTDVQAAFEARLLKRLAGRNGGEERLGLLLEQALAWERAEDTARGLEVVGEAFMMAVENEKQFTMAVAFLQKFPPAYRKAALAALEKKAIEEGDVDIEKKRILLVRQSNDPDQLLAVLREAIERFPEETSFLIGLRKTLESEGRYYEAIEVLEALLELEPDNPQFRTEFAAAWNRLAHPVKARKYLESKDAPNAASPSEATGRATQSNAPRPADPQRSAPEAGKVAVGAPEEKPLEKASTQILKKHYEADDFDLAAITLRNLWRQFSALDQASRSAVYRRPYVNSRYYEWPVQKTGSVTAAQTVSSGSGQGGLKAFLETNPLSSIYHRSNPVPLPTLFSAIGSEEFVLAETEAWLQTLDTSEFRGTLFDEMLKEVVKHRIATQGLELFLADALAEYFKGELSLLDRNGLLTALELHPEVEGDEVNRFLDEVLVALDPADLWQAIRMARCFAKRGDQETALSLYRWCGANTASFRQTSYNSSTVSGNLLVEEIRRNLEGEFRRKALESVFQLVSSGNASDSLQNAIANFVLATWEEEVATHEVYSLCPETCHRVIQSFPSTRYKSHRNLELATKFLAAGGKTEEALEGLKLIFFPGEQANLSGTRRTRNFYFNLQQLFPEEAGKWTNADQWFSGVAGRVETWATTGKLPMDEAIQILSLVAVRQFQNGFEESARQTLAAVGRLPQTNPEAMSWFSDAAERIGDETLALLVRISQLKQKRLPITRVAPLIETVAKTEGVPRALELAEIAYEYTGQPEFLQTMVRICEAAQDQENAKLWQDRINQSRDPQSHGIDSTASETNKKAEEDYRKIVELSREEQHLPTLESGEAFLKTYLGHPRLPAVLFFAGKAGVACSNFERATPLLQRLVAANPKFGEVNEARHLLAQCLSATRSLEACIQHCRESLKVAPEAPMADYWAFLIPQSQFRLWQFKKAETGLNEFLANHPDSNYAEYARRYLAKINPKWKVDENGIGAYSGKYDGDYRLEAALSDLPNHIAEGHRKIRERLGVDFFFPGKINFIIRDTEPGKQNSFTAHAYTICRGYEAVSVIEFYAEQAVIDPDGFRKTVVHELKHAGFKFLMENRYNDLPEWIIEGLAQWGAEQLDDRMVSKLNSDTFAGKDPASQLNGVANPNHDLGDYLEDVLAFEWLEKQKPGNVETFSRGLVSGADWEDLLASTSGFSKDEALSRMDDYCRERVEDVIGKAGREAITLRDGYFAKAKEGAAELKSWLQEEGNRKFAEWVNDNPGHVLEPVMRFYSGRGLILAGELAEGRGWLRGIIDADGASRLSDDVLFWEGYAFQQENRAADAAKCFGILLRDYSWSNSAKKIRGRFEPAGPMRNPL